MNTTQKIEFWTAANVTYSNSTFNTRILVEYAHTGTQYFYKRKGQRHESYTENKEIADNQAAQGIKVRAEDGHFYIKRIAIPTINAKGEKDIWYINNPGDYYRINKVSKYGKKIHALLSQNINPFSK